MHDAGGAIQVTTSKAVSAASAVTMTAVDYKAQEDARLFAFVNDARVAIEGEPIDISRESNGDMALQIEYQILGDNVADTVLSIGCGEGCSGNLDITKGLIDSLNKGWQVSRLKLSCFAERGADMTKVDSPFTLSVSGVMQIQISSVNLVSNQGDASCSL